MSPRQFFLFFLQIGVALCWTRYSHAATFVIADGDVSALKNAITASNANGEDDTIRLATNGTYVLTVAETFYYDGYDGLPVVLPDGGKTLTIEGRGATIQRSTVAGTGKFRFLFLEFGSNLTVLDTTFNNGDVAIPGEYHFGGAIYNYHATATFVNCRFLNNSARVAFGSGDAGAIYNDGGGGTAYANLTVRNSVFTGNVCLAYGGAIFNNGDLGNAVLTVSDCSFTNNSGSKGGAICNTVSSSVGGNAIVVVSRSSFTGNTAFAGGAIFTDAYAESASLTVIESTLNDNHTTLNGLGGAIYSRHSAVTLANATLSGNTAETKGGGIYNTIGLGPRVALTNCTLSGNSAAQGGAICNDGDNASDATTTLRGTILKAGTSGENIFNSAPGVVESLGYNISSDNGSGFLTAVGDQINTDPQFDPAGLKNNGGPTQTIGLLPGSPAINAGNDGAALHRDQRGYFRNGRSDIGAFEYQGGLVGTSSIARSGNNIVVSAEVVQGKTYRIERKLSLTDANWQSIPGVVDLVATGNDTESITDLNALNLGKAFYRARLLP